MFANISLSDIPCFLSSSTRSELFTKASTGVVSILYWTALFAKSLTAFEFNPCPSLLRPIRLAPLPNTPAIRPGIATSGARSDNKAKGIEEPKPAPISALKPRGSPKY